ncbi:hypothetical protein POL68_34130 [Stigmatella sp. ncwal1]|uniref:Uncharacterized protein n=1 Tax=Stigmatella ashevillensis TaxID=2995309 RepID=A0ABT5DIZ4_9BACT|nr:hypothetical protein [Stigmatella ashevillena]MDC0713554.1 hypothetical protein [Stigmatella ashevillena]
MGALFLEPGRAPSLFVRSMKGAAMKDAAKPDETPPETKTETVSD